MLVGRFGDTTASPYFEGRLFLPELGLIGDISFLADTGADKTILMPIDGARLGIDYSKLKNRVVTFDWHNKRLTAEVQSADDTLSIEKKS